MNRLVRSVVLNLFLARGTCLDIRKKAIGGTLIPEKIFKGLKNTNCQQTLFIFPKRVVKVRTKNMAAHLEGVHGTPVEKHWVRCSREGKPPVVSVINFDHTA